jgi:hypothetical protein
MSDALMPPYKAGVDQARSGRGDFIRNIVYWMQCQAPFAMTTGHSPSGRMNDLSR